LGDGAWGGRRGRPRRRSPGRGERGTAPAARNSIGGGNPPPPPPPLRIGSCSSSCAALRRVGLRSALSSASFFLKPPPPPRCDGSRPYATGCGAATGVQRLDPRSLGPGRVRIPCTPSLCPSRPATVPGPGLTSVPGTRPTSHRGARARTRGARSAPPAASERGWTASGVRRRLRLRRAPRCPARARAELLSIRAREEFTSSDGGGWGVVRRKRGTREPFGQLAEGLRAARCSPGASSLEVLGRAPRTGPWTRSSGPNSFHSLQGRVPLQEWEPSDRHWSRV